MTITKERRGEYAKLAFSLLRDAGGELHVQELLAQMEPRLSLTAEELETYDNGYPRWNVGVRFASTSWAKGGFIRKLKGGRWYLTPEGEALIDQPPAKVQQEVRSRYLAWRDRRDAEKPVEQEDTELAGDEASFVLEDAEDRARQEIRDFIRKMDAYEFQDLVAALLRGMGYVTPFVAPKGPDGGTDVLAYLDPLGAKTPHIRVQVKHRQERASNAEIASLQGNIHPVREIGLFVAIGGFTKEAERQMQRGQAHMELIDLDRFIDLWIEYYPKLDDEDRARLALRMVAFLAPS